MTSYWRITGFLTLTVLGGPAFAGEADVIDAKISKSGAGTYTISATLKHGDTGWDHYADGWDVLAPDGTVLGTRKLLHPHVEEQPFTRSLSGVTIPDGTEFVTIRARDSVHGTGGAEFRLAMPD